MLGQNQAAVENTDASLLFHSASGTEACWAAKKKGIVVLGRSTGKEFSFAKINKNIKWTSSEGTLKEYFIHSIFISGYFL